MRIYFTGGAVTAFLTAGLSMAIAADPAPPSLITEAPYTDGLQLPPRSSIWASQPGEGFAPSAQSLSIEVGASDGVAVFGGHSGHDFALFSMTYGHMISGVVASNHWYRGNWELRAEIFGGEQYAPREDWLIGAAPHLRYNFATGTPLVPFLDVGAGLSATSIGAPSLGGVFEFNLQAGAGVQWFVKDNLALTLEGKFLHLSSAGLEDPNLGVNTAFGMVGITWFF